MNEDHSSPHSLKRLLNINELGNYLGVTVATINDWPTNSKGFRAYRFDKRIVFGVIDVRAWMDTMPNPTFSSPAQGPPFPEWGRPRVGGPHTPIGTFGIIATSAQFSGNRLARTRTRYRDWDWDGRNRVVQATEPSRSAAERKPKLADRSLYQPEFNGMSADSLFPELVDYRLENNGDRRPPLTLREIGVARCNYFLAHFAKRSYSRAKHARVVLALAVHHEILPRNPMDHVSCLHRKTIPGAFTIGEVQEIRAAIKAWESRRLLAGPRPDRHLG
ncbi:hypothetical protein [Changpingibacter yushuensis]|uniref:hypothetical protein n=1 Tax=Changpingibacter yushuensis TaxID=2758440 RepID=UPI001CB6CB01|nr:hypothetical protein [Changpingibacter yushuensis]